MTNKQFLARIILAAITAGTTVWALYEIHKANIEAANLSKTLGRVETLNDAIEACKHRVNFEDLEECNGACGAPIEPRDIYDEAKTVYGYDGDTDSDPLGLKCDEPGTFPVPCEKMDMSLRYLEHQSAEEMNTIINRVRLEVLHGEWGVMSPEGRSDTQRQLDADLFEEWRTVYMNRWYVAHRMHGLVRS